VLSLIKHTKKTKMIALSLYSLYLLIGHYGPFAVNSNDLHHPHTHTHNSIKLLKKEADLDRLTKARKYTPLSAS
jgi:hypothetical protein